MKVLITGGAGFIGSRTAVALVDRGHSVTIIDSFSPQVHGDIPDLSPTWGAIRDRVETVHGDVRDADVMANLVPKHDAIVHLAAETGTGQSMYEIARYCDVNLQGTATLLQAIADRPNNVTRLVVASSRAVYGEGRYACFDHGDQYPKSRDPVALQAGHFDPACPECGARLVPLSTPETAPLETASVYAVTKLAQEKLILAFAQARGISAFALRYQNVWGPGQSLSNPYTGILSIFSTLMLQQKPIEVFEDGLESRDFIHVSDVAAINTMALERLGGGCHVVNIGTGIPIAVADIVRSLGKAYSYSGTVTVSGRYRAGDIRHNFADVTLAAKLFPAFTPSRFEAGVEEFADWARANASASDGADHYRQSLDELERRGLMGVRRQII
jgi:dTDP-L-rhamnose 4-epimerase